MCHRAGPHVACNCMGMCCRLDTAPRQHHHRNGSVDDRASLRPLSDRACYFPMSWTVRVSAPLSSWYLGAGQTGAQAHVVLLFPAYVRVHSSAPASSPLRAAPRASSDALCSVRLTAQAHPGRNNNFMVNASTPLALTYNDISVLENMHASLTFRLLCE